LPSRQNVTSVKYKPVVHSNQPEKYTICRKKTHQEREQQAARYLEVLNGTHGNSDCDLQASEATQVASWISAIHPTKIVSAMQKKINQS